MSRANPSDLLALQYSAAAAAPAVGLPLPVLLAQPISHFRFLPACILQVHVLLPLQCCCLLFSMFRACCCCCWLQPIFHFMGTLTFLICSHCINVAAAAAGLPLSLLLLPPAHLPLHGHPHLFNLLTLH
jgi:hypothetical protein